MEVAHILVPAEEATAGKNSPAQESSLVCTHRRTLVERDLGIVAGKVAVVAQLPVEEANPGERHPG